MLKPHLSLSRGLGHGGACDPNYSRCGG
jgi:hypothetical protein